MAFEVSNIKIYFSQFFPPFWFLKTLIENEKSPICVRKKKTYLKSVGKTISFALCENILGYL